MTTSMRQQRASRTPGRQRAIAFLRPRGEPLLVGALVLLFLTTTIWWLLYDQRPPGGGDPARHVGASEYLADRLAELDVLAPLTYIDAFGYPPLVRVVGAVPAMFGLPTWDWGPIATSIVFVPLLAFGCYFVGSRVFGRRAGVLAALFALGSPMVMQLFRVHLLDAPLAAAVAIATAALLASERFSRTRESMLAGALVGITMLVKFTGPIFVAGVIIVSLVRGGWRQGRNLALAALAAVVVAGPFYVMHFEVYAPLFGEATLASEDPWTRAFGASFEGAERFSPDSFMWYGWAAVNTQYLVPLLAFFVIGLVFTLSKAKGRPYVPELLGGLALGYLAMTLLSVHDARYTLPLVVYVAVIGTGWLAISPTLTRVAGTAVLAAFVALNVMAGTFGWLGTLKLTLPGGYDRLDLIHPGALTLVDKRGYVVGEPRPDDFWERLLAAVRRNGYTVELKMHETAFWGTDPFALEAMALHYGIQMASPDPFTRRSGDQVDVIVVRPDVVVRTWWTSDDYWRGERGLARPCAVLEEGIGDPDVEGVPLRVLVERERGGRYARWCEFDT